MDESMIEIQSEGLLQTCCVNMNCIGQFVILTEHFRPEPGKVPCEIPQTTTRQFESREFIIDLFDERNKPGSQKRYGRCSYCDAALILDVDDIYST